MLIMRRTGQFAVNHFPRISSPSPPLFPALFSLSLSLSLSRSFAVPALDTLRMQFAHDVRRRRGLSPIPSSPTRLTPLIYLNLFGDFVDIWDLLDDSFTFTWSPVSAFLLLVAFVQDGLHRVDRHRLSAFAWFFALLIFPFFLYILG